MNNLFKLFWIDVLDNYFAQQLDQEKGQNKSKFCEISLIVVINLLNRFQICMFWNSTVVNSRQIENGMERHECLVPTDPGRTRLASECVNKDFYPTVDQLVWSEDSVTNKLYSVMPKNSLMCLLRETVSQLRAATKDKEKSIVAMIENKFDDFEEKIKKIDALDEKIGQKFDAFEDKMNSLKQEVTAQEATIEEGSYASKVSFRLKSEKHSRRPKMTKKWKTMKKKEGHVTLLYTDRKNLERIQTKLKTRTNNIYAISWRNSKFHINPRVLPDLVHLPRLVKDPSKS